jgi:hypothetical protein
MAKKNSVKGAKRVLVTGDVIIDHHIYQGKREAPCIKTSPGTMVVESPGGARLLYEIIKKTSELTKDSIKKAEVEVEEKSKNLIENLVEYTVLYSSV